MNIIEHVESCGYDVQKTGKPSEYIMVCPQCGKKKLGINIDKKKWQCFKCATGGGINALCRFLNIKSFDDSTTDFKGLRNWFVDVATKKPVATLTNTTELPREYIKIGQNIGNFMERNALNFLHNRGVTDRQIQDWNLGYCISGAYTGMLIIPVSDLEGNVRTFQARRIFGAGMKSKNPTSIDKIIFNLQHAQGFPGIIVVEGPFDAMAVHSRLSGTFNISSVALLGHSCSPLQARQIAQFLKPEYLWIGLDPDIPRAECERMAGLFKNEGIHNVKVLFLPKDPDDIVNIDEWKKLLEDAEETSMRRINR